MNAWSEPAAPPRGGVASVRLKSSGCSHGRCAAGKEPRPPGSSPRSAYSRKAGGRYGSSTSAELQLLCTSQSINGRSRSGAVRSSAFSPKLPGSSRAARQAMSLGACESLSAMLREFDARLQKGDNPGAWTCVLMDDAAELFGTRGLVKIRGAIDGEPFDGALMAQGDGTHRLPVKAKLRNAIGKGAGDTVHVRIDERIG